MRRIIDALRDHCHFIAVIALLIAVMTFPTIVYVFNTEVFWLPTGNHPDTWMKFWDAWYGRLILSGRADFSFTDLLFYPRGLPLVYHNFSIPHMFIFGGLQALMPASNAYSLTFLLIVASVACSAYVYMLYLFKDKWIALLGSVVVGMSPYVVGYPEHPELRFIATVPLALYFFHRGMAERSYKLVAIAAATTGLTAYISMHTAVCLIITLIMYTLCFAVSRWKEAAFWVALGLFAVTAGTVSSLRTYPLLKDPQALEQAMESRKELEVGNDLLEYFVNARHPLVISLFQQPFAWGLDPLHIRYASYIGYTALVLVGFGFLRKTYRRRMTFWMLLALPFLLLRLGSVLTIDGVSYPSIVLPKHFLDEFIPGLTKGFTLTSCFYAGVLIPLAALVCLGASALVDAFGASRRPIVVLILVGLLSFEYYQPVRPGVMTEQEFAFLNWLKEESDDVRVINLPMSGRFRRLYSFHQTQNGYPRASGVIARTPQSAFTYIGKNLLLETWQRFEAVTCTWQTKDKYLSAIEELEADGFTHVIYHRDHLRAYPFYHRAQLRENRFAASFAAANPSYKDDFVSIYTMDDLRAPCEKDFVAEIVAASPFSDAYLSPSIVHQRHGVVLSFHQTQPVHPKFLSYFSHRSFDQKSAVHISYDRQGELVLQSNDDSFTDLDIISDFTNGVWLINGKQEARLAQIPAYDGWLKKRFRFCDRYMDRDDASIDLYLKPNIPCEAVGDPSKFEVHFDSGTRLHHLSYDLHSDRLIFYVSWTNAAENPYSFSLQFFDEQGEKAYQYDSVIRREVVSVHTLDISSFHRGSYRMMLIVYDYETGASAGGTVIETGQRFERELEIATIERS